nr:unnamed protein product [Spirometra erinaceieuropaei]
MFRVMYVFVVIHVLRGCPKTIPLTHHESNERNAGTPNSSSICVSQKLYHFPGKLYKDNDVFPIGKIPSDTRYTHTMYTGLLPAGIPNFLQPSYIERVLGVKPETARLISELIQGLLTGAFSGVIIGIPMIMFMDFVHEKNLQIERQLTSAENA